MADRKYWSVPDWGAVMVSQKWGNPVSITLTSDDFPWTRKKTIQMGQIQALRLADLIFSAYGFGGSLPNWKARFPDEFPSGTE